MSSHNSKYYAKSLKTNPVKSKNIKTLFCQQSTKESTETSSSTSIDLNSEKIAEGAIQHISISVSVQQTSTSISTQLIPTLLYVPPTSSFPIQTTSTSAVAIIPSSVSPSPIEKPLKRTTKPKDFRLTSTEKYEILFHDFYYSTSKNGWIQKICSSFTTEKGDQTFMKRLGNIGDNPTERFTNHLKIKRHKKATKNKMTYLEMCNRGTNVWKLARDASLALNTTKIARNRFVIKSFFRIIHSMIIKVGHIPIIFVMLLISLFIVVVKIYPLT